MNEAKTHWEERYAERDKIWSGRVNVQFAELVGDLAPGRALDLGCGEGGDSVWLAEKGWDVVAVDISQTALGRAEAEATARRVADRISFVQMDLADDFPDGDFDLISAQFLHSTVRLERPQVLAAALRALRPGGVLVIVDHGAAPPWAGEHIHHHEFPSADEVLDELKPGDDIERVRVETRERDAVGPEGQSGTLIDNVMVLRRRASA